MPAFVWALIILGVVILLILHCVWKHYYIKKIQALHRQNENIWIDANEVIS